MRDDAVIICALSVSGVKERAMPIQNTMRPVENEGEGLSLNEHSSRKSELEQPFCE